MHDEISEQKSSKMNIFQLSSQLKHTAKSIPKLKIQKSVRSCNGRYCTVFSQAIAMTATFSDEMIFEGAQVISNEAHAKQKTMTSAYTKALPCGHQT